MFRGFDCPDGALSCRDGRFHHTATGSDLFNSRFMLRPVWSCLRIELFGETPGNLEGQIESAWNLAIIGGRIPGS